MLGTNARRLTALRSPLIRTAAACLLLGAGGAAADVEPWADARLPLREGLRAWPDAGRGPAGERAAEGPLLECWRDASGAHRDFAQPEPEARPQLVTAEGREASLGVVAAPTNYLGMSRGVLAGAKHGEDDQNSGLTVDLGPFPSTRPETINVDGRGFQGSFNVASSPRESREFLTLSIRIGSGTAGAEVAPPPRTRAEWDAAMKGRKAPADAAARPMRITLAAGPKDHGIDEHDYPLWLARWSKLLRSAPNVTVREVPNGNGLDFADESDVIVWYSANPSWTEEQAPRLRAFLDRGGGLVVLHWGVAGGKAVDSLADLLGLAASPTIKYRHGPLDLDLVDPKSPITEGLSTPLHLVDESYWQLTGDPSRIDVLATAAEEGEPRPLIWTRRQGKGRVFVSIPGHYTWTFDDPLFRVVLLRALAWAADHPVDRLIDLATDGARLE